jgi:hypothetical protein
MHKSAAPHVRRQPPALPREPQVTVGACSCCRAAAPAAPTRPPLARGRPPPHPPHAHTKTRLHRHGQRLLQQRVLVQLHAVAPRARAARGRRAAAAARARRRRRAGRGVAGRRARGAAAGGRGGGLARALLLQRDPAARARAGSSRPNPTPRRCNPTSTQAPAPRPARPPLAPPGAARAGPHAAKPRRARFLAPPERQRELGVEVWVDAKLVAIAAAAAAARAAAAAAAAAERAAALALRSQLGGRGPRCEPRALAHLRQQRAWWAAACVRAGTASLPAPQPGRKRRNTAAPARAPGHPSPHATQQYPIPPARLEDGRPDQDVAQHGPRRHRHEVAVVAAVDGAVQRRQLLLVVGLAPGKGGWGRLGARGRRGAKGPPDGVRPGAPLALLFGLAPPPPFAAPARSPPLPHAPRSRRTLCPRRRCSS